MKKPVPKFKVGDTVAHAASKDLLTVECVSIEPKRKTHPVRYKCSGRPGYLGEDELRQVRPLERVADKVKDLGK